MAEERAQRRLAAILVANVVGYSRLMQADEAGTLAALKARRRDVFQPAIARHRGRIFKVMGNGVLVEFPSAMDAVECAVAPQKAWIRPTSGCRKTDGSYCASESTDSPTKTLRTALYT